ncbi:MAG: hypothetical protein QXO69_03075 [archaeon]
MMRGQEEAPIELLIGVTILTFVIIIGMYVFNSSCATQQEQKLRASFSKFARDLELVYFGSTGTSQITRIDFTQSAGCADYSIDSIRITKGPTATCNSQLGRPDCLVLSAVSTGRWDQNTGQMSPKETLLVEVLDISSSTRIKNKFSGGCSFDLNDLDWDVQNVNKIPSDCWFTPAYYTLKIAKTAPDEITISKVS